MKRELETYKAERKYQRELYSAKNMDDEMICMETGLPNKDIFNIVVGYVYRFQRKINYFAGWKVKSGTLEDQLFMTIMKYVIIILIFTWLNSSTAVLQL